MNFSELYNLDLINNNPFFQQFLNNVDNKNQDISNQLKVDISNDKSNDNKFINDDKLIDPKINSTNNDKLIDPKINPTNNNKIIYINNEDLDLALENDSKSTSTEIKSASSINGYSTNLNKNCIIGNSNVIINRPNKVNLNDNKSNLIDNKLNLKDNKSTVDSNKIDNLIYDFNSIKNNHQSKKCANNSALLNDNSTFINNSSDYFKDAKFIRRKKLTIRKHTYSSDQIKTIPKLIKINENKGLIESSFSSIATKNKDLINEKKSKINKKKSKQDQTELAKKIEQILDRKKFKPLKDEILAKKSDEFLGKYFSTKFKLLLNSDLKNKFANFTTNDQIKLDAAIWLIKNYKYSIKPGLQISKQPQIESFKIQNQCPQVKNNQLDKRDLGLIIKFVFDGKVTYGRRKQDDDEIKYYCYLKEYKK